MAVPILPQFNAAAPLPLGLPSQWTESNDPAFLDNLVKSLAQGAPLENIGSIDSIPHVWAKPLLFKMALFDNAHEFVVGLKEHVTGEWRALLAMLALKDVLHLDLTVSHINLTENIPPNIAHLAKVFEILAPKKEALDGNDTAWVTNTYVINFKGAPIAMTSPVTLVATAADYAANVKECKISLTDPWSKDGLCLTDPIPYLSNFALNALKFWLDDLVLKLHGMHGANGANQALITSLLDCLSSYIKDINKKIRNNLTPEGTFGFTPSSLNLTPLLNGLLQNTVKIVVAAPSAVELVLTGTTKKFLLMSPQMLQTIASQIKVPLSHVAIWGGLMANHITDASLENGHNQIGKVVLDGIEWRRPEEFFQEKMVLLAGSKVFCNSLSFKGETTKVNNSEYTAILPIKPELAEIFYSSDLHTRISIEYSDDNGKATATLTFDFPLSGIEGKNIIYSFEKVYSAEKLIKAETTDVPVVEIWPDFICDSWNTYYLHYSNARSEAADSANDQEGSFCFFEPWSSKGTFTADIPPNGLADIFTSNMNDFPEALICTYVSDGNAIKAGMVFLKKPDKITPKAALDWKIGIDFGTSATMLFFSQDNDSQPLNLKPRLYQITNSDAGTRATRTILNFISNNDKLIRDGSFLSAFHLLNHQITDKDDIKPLQDGHVLLLTSKSPYHKKESQYAAFIDTNIKWDKTNKLKAYIHQICMQAFVETISAKIGKVTWNFSYPLAFTPNQYQYFRNTCNNVIGGLQGNNTVNFFSESEALAYYFYNLCGGQLPHSICIDIGAGTTDISVISDAPRRIVFHTSVKYAGRHIFNSIYENFSLFVNNGTDYKNALTSKEEQATIDLDMRDNSERYIRKFGEVLVQPDTEVQATYALQLAHLAVAGLFYYLGKILKVLHKTNFYTSDMLPQVFVGGNGARIFNWMTQSNIIESDDPYVAVLKDMLSTASEWEEDKCDAFSLTLSETPKVEVASGMISPPPKSFYDGTKINKTFSSKFGERYTPESVIAGDKFSTDSVAPFIEDFLNATDIKQKITIDEKLTEFKTFIHAFDESSKLNRLYNNVEIAKYQNFDNIIKVVCDATRSFYEDQIGQNPTTISVEPIFIVELRELVKNARRLS